MVAYVVFTREKTTNQAELDTYARKAQAAAEGHNVSFLALYGKHEVLEGPTMEPTERSIPRIRITVICASASMASTAVSSRRARRESALRKTGARRPMARIMPATIRARTISRA